MTALTAQERQQRKTLLVVLILNGLLFAALGVGGLVADSSALIANAVDNGSDTAVYLISFLAVGRAGAWKRRAARISGVMLLIFAVGVLLDVGRRWIYGAEPVGWTMMTLALVAAVVNIVCLLLLRRVQSQDVNMRAAETFSLNDFASNGGILVAGALVMWLGRSWPDLVVGIAVAIIAVKGGVEILRDAAKATQEHQRSPAMTEEKLRLEIPVLLPGAADACERCVAELTAVLKRRPGVIDAHVDGREDARLCVHFDPTLIAPSQLRALAEQQGARIDAKFGHATMRLPLPLHARAARTLADDLRGVPGVVRAEVGPTGVAVVEFDRGLTDEKTLKAFLNDHAAALGQAPASASASRDEHAGHKHKPGEGHGHKHGGVFGERTELVFALLSGLALLVGWLASFRLSGPVPLAFYGLSYIFGGYFTLREAVESLRKRRFEIDTLMLVAAAGAAALGEWAEGALLLVLFSLGHALEHYAMGRARRAIEALAALAPERASRRRGEAIEEVAVEALEVGDIVLVRPNERLPADGVVIIGESAVNQAPVTGESVPVDKSPAPQEATFESAEASHRVFAGTINGAGALEVRVARRASETTLARVVTMVAEAEAQRSPTQRFTDKFERIFVPAVLLMVAMLMFAWLVVDEPFSVSFYRAMAVLVAASPCALAISVPSAVLSGVARAGRGGVLVKGGGPLENLGTLKALAFDKTGTLTEGRPRVTDVVPAIGVTKERLLETAAAVEAQSDHPLAAAVVTAATETLTAAPGRAESVESITGQGVRGRYGGEDVFIGKLKLFEAIDGPPVPEEVRSEAERLARSGRTVMVVRSAGAYLGVLALQDTPREGAAEVIAQLRGMGLKRLVMLSGDNQGVADAIASQLGLTEARGGLMPEDKVEFIKTMREQEGRVAMVGDGVNDAPAMANATVGVAMGAAGSDVALETADVALMADDLRRLPFAVGLSRRTSAVIKQNLFVSLGMVAFLIPATIFGLKIGAAVIFHEGSTLLVVANALRLLAYREGAFGALGGTTPRDKQHA